MQVPKRLSAIALVFTVMIAVHSPPYSKADNEALESSRLARLKQDIREGKTNALSSFWEEITKQGTPLVESIKDDENNLPVTFLWREQKDVKVLSITIIRSRYTRCSWSASSRQTSGTRYPTKFQPDPLNSHGYERFKPNIFSIVGLPKVPPRRWTTVTKSMVTFL